MKKIYTLLFAASALFAATSCQEEIVDPTLEDSFVKEAMTITATVGAETKTVLGNNGVSTFWTDKDQISVFDSNKEGNNRKFSVVTENVEFPAATATFALDAEEEFVWPQNDQPDPLIVALYPYQKDAYCDFFYYDRNYITGLNIPVEQKAVKNAFDLTATFALATGKYSTKDELQFTNLYSLLRVTLKEEGVTKVRVTMTGNNIAIAGEAKVQLDLKVDGEVPYFNGGVLTASGSNSVTLECEGGFEVGEKYYIAVAPVTYTNIKVELLKGETWTMVKNTTPENPKKLEANHIYNISDLDDPKTVADGVYLNEDGVYEISNESGLFWLADQVKEGNTFDGKTVSLVENIEMTKAWEPIGKLPVKTEGMTDAESNAYARAHSFKGTFLGNDKTISNLNVVANEAVGFFGAKWDGDVYNVKFDNANVSGNHYAGVVVGWADGAQCNYRFTISGCEVTASTVTLAAEWDEANQKYDNGDKAGALVGYAYAIIVKNNKVENTTIKGYRDLGGLVGSVNNNSREGTDVIDNQLGKDVIVIVDNTHNYQNYTSADKHNVGHYVGRDADKANGVQSIVSGNTGEATLVTPKYYEEIAEGVRVTALGVYEITNEAGLFWLAEQVNTGKEYFEGKTIKLIDDIDLDGEEWTPIGSASKEHGFMGNFDGDNKTIKNLNISNISLDKDGYAYAGLFGVTEGTDKDNQNCIKNLTIENVTISTTGHIVAAAIAYPYYTVVENVTVKGDIKIKGGDYTAGVLAYTRRCVDVSNISIEGNTGSSIEGGMTVGGVISDIQMNGGLTANYSDFKASGLTITAEMHVGGISGIISKQTLNGATVENVTIICEDVRKGQVSGALGDTSTIKNISVTNVTGATNVVGATFKDGAAVVGDENGVYTAKVLVERNLAFSDEDVSATYGESFTLPTLSGEKTGVKYRSSNTAVATVDETTGAITYGTTVGETTITASAEANETHLAGEASYTLTVAKATRTLSFSSSTASATYGESFTAPTLTGDVDGVSFSSSTPGVATVNNKGEVTLVAGGTAKITATLTETATHTGASAYYTLTVKEKAVIRINNKNGWSDLNITIKSGSTTLVSKKAMTQEGDNIFVYKLDPEYVGTEVTYYLEHSWYQTSTKSVTLATESSATAITLNTTYLQPNDWNSDSPRYGAHIWITGQNGIWKSAVKVKDNFYEVELPEGNYTNIIWCRMNPNNTANNWNSVWNQTGNLTLQHKCYCIQSGDAWNQPTGNYWY